jgi:pyruvate-formate lyase
MSLILEAWELENIFVSFGSRSTNLRQYIQDDLKNDEEFYKGVVSTSFMKLSSMSEYKKKEEDFPSLLCIK